MRYLVATSLMLAAASFAAPPASAPATHAAPTTSPSPLDLRYRREHSASGYRDLVTLDNGEKLMGQALEWGTSVLVYDAGREPRVIPGSRVTDITLRRDPYPTTRPNGPDLTIAWLERPESGAGACVVHVLNAGTKPAPAFGVRLTLAGRELFKGRVEEPLAPGASRAVPAGNWPAEVDCTAGPVVVELDTAASREETTRWNDRLVESPCATAVSVLVDEQDAARFATTRNAVDTFCVEDWVQHHVATLNRLAAESIPTDAPSRGTAKFRIGSILTTSLELEMRKPVTTRPAVPCLRVDSKHNRKSQRVLADRPIEIDPARTDWSLIANSLWPLAPPQRDILRVRHDQILVRETPEAFAQVEMPFPDNPSFMDRPGPLLFAPLEGKILSAAPTKANWPEWMPKESSIRVLANDGAALPGVEVALFQQTPGPNGSLIIPPDPLIVGESDANGRLVLPNRPEGSPPNPFGAIWTFNYEGAFLARLRKSGASEYHFLTAVEYVEMALAGQQTRAEKVLRTRLAATPVPLPQFVLIRHNYDDPGDTTLYLQFPAVRGGTALEYLIYARPARDPRWSLIDVLPASAANARDFMVYHARIDALPQRTPNKVGTEFAIATVNRQGQAGPLCAPLFVPTPRNDPVRLAIRRDSGSVQPLLVVEGPINGGVIRSDESSTFADFALRSIDFPEYEPYAAGATFDDRGRLIVADPRGGLIAIYEEGQLTQLIKSPTSAPATTQPGSFVAPVDVATDERQRIYVADPGAGAVFILDADGTLLGRLEPAVAEAKFEKPSALGCASGRLCVSDSNGARVQVYDVSGDAPKPLRLIRAGLSEAGRALPGRSGRVYVVAKSPAGDGAVLTYPPENDLTGRQKYERFLDYTARGRLRGAQGFCPDGRGAALLVTRYPYRLHKFDLE